MDLNWKGNLIPVLHLEEDDIISFLENRLKIKFNHIKEENGLKYGLLNKYGSTVEVLTFISPKDNAIKSGIVLTVKQIDTWHQAYMKIDKKELTDEDIKEILNLYIDEVNNI